MSTSHPNTGTRPRPAAHRLPCSTRSGVVRLRRDPPYSAGAEAIVEAISTHLSPRQPQKARGTAIGLFALLVGTLQLARAVSDEKLSAEVLESGLKNALSFIR